MMVMLFVFPFELRRKNGFFFLVDCVECIKEKSERDLAHARRVVLVLNNDLIM